MNKNIYIYNHEQAIFYMAEKGIKPVEKPRVHFGTGKIFYTFDREETKEAYEAWLIRKNK